MTRRELTRALRRIELPRAPATLRERVMSAARDAPRSRPTVADRLFFSPGWRLAWCTAVLALALLEWRMAGAVGPASTPGLEAHEGRAAAAEIGLDVPVLLGRAVTSGDPADDRSVVQEVLQ
jgi:hypothetical protein